MFLSILHPETKKLFELIARKKNRPYTLVWGTALALHIGHRESTDLDFVSYTEISEKDIVLFTSLWSKSQIVYQSDVQLDLIIDNVKVTLFTYYRKNATELVPHQNINLRSIEDIATSKAYTIGRRNELKDYIDIYFLVHGEYCTLLSLVHGAEHRFQGAFSKKLFLKQLFLIDQCEVVEIKFIDINHAPSVWDIDLYLHTQVEKIL